ncbi:MAG: helix-hairpin-helix domain-containing protein [Bacteroidota bacterium]
MLSNRKEILKKLQTIPGVGKSISVDLYNLGIRSVHDLQKKKPERLFEKHCTQKGVLVDRCMLYVLRCAVYYASTKNPKPELLRWWN